jgi:hypothetical protein
MSRFRTPIIAALLAIIPFFMFFGAANTLTVNGELVSDSRLNLLGVGMALAGIVLVFGVVRPSAPKDAARKGLAALAGLLCMVQLANAIDVIRIEPLDWIFPDRKLPALEYTGLKEHDRNVLSSYEPEAYRRALLGNKGEIMGFARQHAAYADLCHGGRYRIDLDRAERLPDYFNESDIAGLKKRAETLARATPSECTTRHSNHLMGEIADNVNRDMDLADRLEADYLQSIQ